MDKVSTPKTSNRLLALDILRGITIAGMMLVNNPGSWSYKYAPLSHAVWHGLTPTDLVFPFFMFIMGVSTYFSLRKFEFKAIRASTYKIVKRTILIFLIGLGLSWFGLTAYSLGAGEDIATAVTHFDTIRIFGVLQRLALAYGLAGIFAILFKQKHLIWVIATLLISYFFILLFGNGFELTENNIIARIDKAIIGVNHMYKSWTPTGERIPFDPEGLLSTIPSIAHVLIGFLFGKLIIENKDNNIKVEKLLIWGTVLAFSGLLLSYGCPINKIIWSPTYVLTTTGFAAQLLGLLIWIIDIRKKQRWSKFFHAFGVNPLIIFVFGGFLANLVAHIKVTYGGEITSLKGVIYSVFLQIYAGNEFGSLLYALMFVCICWLFGYILYKKNIYIKI